ncbi:MAG: hypothetical protein EOO75_01595 [Myxococcales bacterium]|nr:MAG: hypothetical protein EOO75_01595 [Myxococcales bacterium]
MIASAPGKLVVSGAYVVLDGAPAVVTAVDRRATADASRRAVAEHHAQLGPDEVGPPHVDSGSLRMDGRKLGLGSSAAVLVAAIGARELALGRALDADARVRIALEAYEAHRTAQGGGSGIDIVTATEGGTLLCEVASGEPPRRRPVRLPCELVLEVWACPESASTSGLLGPVRELRRLDERRYQALTGPARQGAEQVAEALLGGDLDSMLAGLQRQTEAMTALGEAAGVPILPPYLLHLAQRRDRGTVVMQSGAGGGDIALHLGRRPSSEAWRAEAALAGLQRLTLGVEAVGLQAEPWPPV